VFCEGNRGCLLLVFLCFYLGLDSFLLNEIHAQEDGPDRKKNTCREEPVFLRPHISRDSSLGGSVGKVKVALQASASPHLPDLPTLAMAPIDNCV